MSHGSSRLVGVCVCVCECDVAKMVPSTDPGAADAQSLGI